MTGPLPDDDEHIVTPTLYECLDCGHTQIHKIVAYFKAGSGKCEMCGGKQVRR